FEPYYIMREFCLLLHFSFQHFLITPCPLNIFFPLFHFVDLLTFRNFFQVFHPPSLPVKLHQTLNLIRLGTLSFYKTCHECSSIFFFSSSFSPFQVTNKLVYRFKN